MAGLQVFSSGAAWEIAFREALRFLRETEGTLLLGPGVRDAGQEWLQRNFLGEDGVRLGSRVVKWGEWVKARARDRALSQGKGFRVLNDAARREHVRAVARSLASNDAFYHLKEIWSEERFFSALVDCVGEARRAGLVGSEVIGRAKELLAEGADPVTREAYTDFWNLLELYERLLEIQGEERLDESSLLRLATEAPLPGGPFFLLGFDALSLLEVELVQRMAREGEVKLPLALSPSAILSVLKEKQAPLEHTAALALRGLATNFTGEIVLLEEEAPPPVPPRRLLEAHSPSFEAQAAAALARAVPDRFPELRFVLPEGYFREGGTAEAFREELGLPAHFELGSLLEHPVARLFFHVLELKEKDFTLSYGLELAQLLAYTRPDFAEIPSLAARAGVRKGLRDWKNKSSHPLLQEFASILEELSRSIPSHGRSAQFADAVEKITELAGIAELARRAPDHLAEREAHAALSGILRNAQMLKASVREELTFHEWLRELQASLRVMPAAASSFFPRVQFFNFREWLPPATEGTLTFVLGLHAGSEPRRTFDFFLEERARRKLSDFLFPTRVQEDLAFLDRLRRAGAEGAAVFSWAKHDSLGKEREPSWTAGPLGLVPGKWPEVAPLRPASNWAPPEKILVPAAAPSTFSASLFETYKECPFKAFAERILRLKDKVQESSLDVSRLNEGSLVHKALELYYRDENGKEITDPGQRKSTLEKCLRTALESPEIRIEYYRGNETLLETQVRRLLQVLTRFIEEDAANYARFPFFGKPETERVVQGEVGGYPWEGKIDRLDLDPEGKKLLVVDYKIGATTPKSSDVDQLKKFQLQLYMDAAEKAHPGFEAAGGLYVSVATGDRGQGAVRKDMNAGPKGAKPGERKYFSFGGSSAALFTDEEFRDLRERTRAEAGRLAAKIAEGDFSVTPLDEEESCSRCSMRPACRIRELRAPAREFFPRVAPEALLSLLESPTLSKAGADASKGFNPEQADALSRRGKLVFIEASAGTGKTTVIAERIRRFLAERPVGEPLHQRVEKFAAISFTEKSAQELAARAAKLLLDDPTLGAQVAAQAQQQVSTIHGFCRKILNDFPVEAGISPLSATLDQKGADALEAEVVEDFFLFPAEEARPLLEAAFAEFPRAKVEEILVRLLGERHLIRDDVRSFRSGDAGDRIFPEGGAREVLLNLLDLADRLAVQYDKRKRELNVLDFNDLEMLALKVLDHEHARDHYRKQLELLLVDEFQDTNVIQRTILDAVARPGGTNLFVVGDAKQSIYRFRAADVSVFQRMRQEAADAGSLVTLTRNYRSAREIITAANRITKAIFPAPGEDAPDFEAVDSQAIPGLDLSGKVGLVEYGAADDGRKIDENRALEAKMVAKLVAEIRSRPGKPLSVALLLRKIAGNEMYLRALTDAGVAFRVGSSRGFYGQPVITDAIALLRVLYGAKNDVALLALLRSPWCRVPDEEILRIHRRGEALQALGDKLHPEDAPRLFLWRELATHSSLSGMLERAYREYPLGRRELLQARKLQAIVRGQEEEGKTRAEILERLSAWAGWERESDAQDDAPMPEPGGEGTVQVMTVHAAKGLEFDVTILADLTGRLKGDNSALRIVRGAGLVLKLESEEKSDPYTKIGRKSTERELAELKRLFYVAVTRAKKEEYILLPRSLAAAEPAKWGNCGHFVRAAELTEGIERIDGDAWLASPTAKISGAVGESAASRWPAPPTFDPFPGSSVTKLASFQFCPEFHRRKVVQGWDDQVVAYWPVDPRLRRKTGGTKGRDQGKDYAARLLRALRLESKERGVALHRVLERAHAGDFDPELARLWLKEAYEAQGADIEAPEFHELADIDLELLRRFLDSPLGRELFAPGIEAYPELPFQWNLKGAHLQGSIDRAIRKPDGSWIVVDYKSSILEESLEEYRFQVKAYMAAVRAYAKETFGAEPRIEGFLVDLYACKSVSVSTDPVEATGELEKNVQAVRESYTQASSRDRFLRGGLLGGQHCLKCTYRFHCEIGKELG